MRGKAEIVTSSPCKLLGRDLLIRMHVPENVLRIVEHIVAYSNDNLLGLPKGGFNAGVKLFGSVLKGLEENEKGIYLFLDLEAEFPLESFGKVEIGACFGGKLECGEGREQVPAEGVNESAAGEGDVHLDRY